MIRRRLAVNRALEERTRLPIKRAAATKIQSAWRGFWEFSHYLILQFELVKLQSVVRGHIARGNARFQLGCIIILQAMMRRYLAQRGARDEKKRKLFIASTALSLRENNASKRLQRFWRDGFDEKRKKTAALKIARFFVMVKAEVDREILRYEMKKTSRREQRLSSITKPPETDDSLLERAWLNTVNDTTVGAGLLSPYHCQKLYNQATTNRDARPAYAVRVGGNDDNVSEVTAPTIFNMPSRYSTYSRRELGDDLSLEEAWIDTGIHQAKEEQRMDDEYLRRHGIQHPSIHRNPRHSRNEGAPHVHSSARQGNGRMRHAPSSPITSSGGRESPQFNGHYRPQPSPRGDGQVHAEGHYRMERSTRPSQVPRTGHGSGRNHRTSPRNYAAHGMRSEPVPHHHGHDGHYRSAEPLRSRQHYVSSDKHRGLASFASQDSSGQHYHRPDVNRTGNSMPSRMYRQGSPRRSGTLTPDSGSYFEEFPRHSDDVYQKTRMV